MRYLDKIESAAGIRPDPSHLWPVHIFFTNLLNFFSWSNKKKNEFFFTINKNYYITKLTQKRERKSVDRLAGPASIKPNMFTLDCWGAQDSRTGPLKLDTSLHGKKTGSTRIQGGRCVR